MTEDLTESVTQSTELVFPDDSSGKTYSLQERTVYDAGDVRDEMESEIPRYGSWLPVEYNGEDAWLSAPSQLRSVLVQEDIKPGETFTIDQMQKTGTQESDPYQVAVSFPNRGPSSASQTGLTD